MKIIAIVPMKLNNRRLPQKNTKSFTNGKPLCHYILSTLLTNIVAPTIKMMTGYKFMEQETKKRGIIIFNATCGGMLEEFERVDFDKVWAQ